MTHPEQVWYSGHPIGANEAGPCSVTVIDDQGTRDLPPRNDLVNHSPTGFQWGYAGSGPAQLAFALLMDATRDEMKARAHHQRFKAEVVARWRRDRGWSITRKYLLDWLEHARPRAMARG